MTPLRSGGENGGARFVPLSMLPHLAVLAPDVTFTLLTTEQNYDLLAGLDSSNVHRRLVAASPEFQPMTSEWSAGRRMGGAPVLPPRQFNPRLRWPKWMQRRSSGVDVSLAERLPDVMLCPFTAPFFYDPSVPLVSVVYDLQFLYYPEFFTPEERAIRQRTFMSACRLADRVICISDFVRDTVLANSQLAPERAVTIHLGLLQELCHTFPRDSAATIIRLGLTTGRFLVFPSNFWSHKNHRMLLTALGIYRSWHPQSDLKLVCTGTPDRNMERLRVAADGMGLANYVVLPGFVDNTELAALYQTALGLVFPSLYEGFGMPVLEAMAFDTPVLCSNVTSLPEVVEDAALLFDPRKPAEIARAIERLEAEPELRRDLIQRGRKRVSQFADGKHMARTYLGVLRDIVDRSQRQFADGLHGLHGDGWVGERLVVSFAASSTPRTLELMLGSPAWLPADNTVVTLTASGSGKWEMYPIARGEQLLIRKELPAAGGLIELRVDPVVAPSTLELSDDSRELGCLCEMARIVGLSGGVDLREIRQWHTLT